MKTTVEIPDALFYRAKVAAAHRQVTLKELVAQGLEKVLAKTAPSTATISAEETDYLEISPVTGLPVLKSRQGVVITDELVNQIREEERI